jgi:hypothetical protein
MAEMVAEHHSKAEAATRKSSLQPDNDGQIRADSDSF